ncbi:MAG: L,D-transpeptidase [Chloroflexota bacterium]|nr:L,D-transpeptidase [Chloroflexota bacterium]
MTRRDTTGERRARRNRPLGVTSVALALLLALGMLPVGTRPARVEARATTTTTSAVADLPAEMIPPDMGQAGVQVFVEATAHTLRGQMLDYWRANGAASVYGNPISEIFASSDGYYSQAFENAVFQYRPEYLYTDDPTVRLMPIGQTALRARSGDIRNDGRRATGGGDRRGSKWRPLDPVGGNTVARVLNEGGVYVEETSHTISGDFLAWYEAHEGAFYLGHPLSQPMADRGQTVQWFEGGLLMTGESGTHLAPLAAELSPQLGIDTEPVEQGDLPAFDEQQFWTAKNPNPQGDPFAPGAKRIEVSISKQTLTAYQGDTVILTSLVSTGITPNDTERGKFHVRIKYEKQDMQGFTNGTGEVLGFGEDAPPGTVPYGVKDVPNVMYINFDAEALHGAYWHDNFGTPMSHGCINLPLDVSAFLFGWAPLGTPVSVLD